MKEKQKKNINEFINENVIKAQLQVMDEASMSTSTDIMEIAKRKLAEVISQHIVLKDGIVKKTKNENLMSTIMDMKVICFSKDQILELFEILATDFFETLKKENPELVNKWYNGFIKLHPEIIKK